MDRQQVLATIVVGSILIVVFLCPWRIESSGEIRWSPIYQEPLTYVRSFDSNYGRSGASQIRQEEAEIAYGLLALEVVGFIVVGGLAYMLMPDSDDKDTFSKF